MTRWILIGCVAGCALTVEGKSTTAGTDQGNDTSDQGTNPQQTDPSDTTTPVNTGDDDDDTNTVAANCDGTYDGEYTGADHGTFEARVVTGTGQVFISGISSSVLDGILDIAGDNSLYGDNTGYWMKGDLDPDTCILDGTWGVVELPNIDAGSWTTAL